MRYRWWGGWGLVALAGVLKPTARRGTVLARLGPLPDLTSADLVRSIPLAVLGFWLLVSCEPRRPLAERLTAVAAVLGAALWVTSDLPWNDPLVPFLQGRRHGVHWLDLLIVAPLAWAWHHLRPFARGPLKSTTP